MSSAQVPAWVPVIVAIVGLFGILATQFLTSLRDERRVQLEYEREDARWRRDRGYEAKEKWLERRLNAYSQMMSALEAWGWKLYPPARAVLDRERDLTTEERTELAELRNIMREHLGPINLYASEDVRELTRKAVTSRADFTRALLAGKDSVETLEALWQRSWDVYRDLRTAIRRELEKFEIERPPG